MFLLPLGLLLNYQLVPDLLEHELEVIADFTNGDDDGDRNQGGNQAVFHGGDATTILGNGSEGLGEAGGAQNEVVHNLALLKGLVQCFSTQVDYSVR
jgi:hypothetical protein